VIRRIWSWLEDVPIPDPVERRTAAVVQALSLIGFAWAAATVALSFWPGTPAPVADLLVFGTMVALALLVAFWLLRSGRYGAGLWTAVGGIFFPLAGFILPGFSRGASRVPLLFIPIVLASLLVGRRALVATAVGTVAVLGVAALRDRGFLGGPGSLEPAPIPIGAFAQGALTVLCLAIIVDWFASLLRQALARSLAREVELRATEERFRLAFATSPDLMNIVRMTDGVYVEVNDAFTRLTGWTAQEMVGHTSAERELWVDRDHRAAILERITRGESVTDVELTYQRKDGTHRLGRFSARQVPIGGVPHLIGILRDVTDQRREAQEHQALLEELRHAQKMEAFGRLTGGVAHDFNNILTSMLVSAQLVKMELPAGHPARADVEEFESDARRAAELTRQILSLIRKHDDAPQLLRIEERAGSLEKLLRRVMGASIQVETRFEKEGWPVFVDPGQVEQIILNLAVNARDAMPAGGTLTISTANVGRAAGPGGDGPAGGDFVQITVADTGTGMTPEVLAKAFSPFFTTKGEKGTGLGLATCSEIVRAAGGTISVESSPGLGTRVNILLPRAAATAGPPEASRRLEIHGEETILLVEDDASVRRQAARVLGQLGYAVLDAASASEARAKATRHEGPIHCLVVDYELPDGSGPEVAARIVDGGRPIPTLVVSGSPDGARASQAAGLAFMPKPYAPIDLARRIRLLLDGAGAVAARRQPA
jgi:two-component system cell cycle sensor histidine kinase/response regulator CckA